MCASGVTFRPKDRNHTRLRLAGVDVWSFRFLVLLLGWGLSKGLGQQCRAIGF